MSRNVVNKIDARHHIISSPYEAPAGVSLPDLLDTSIVTPLDGEMMQYNAALSKWINVTPGVDPAVTAAIDEVEALTKTLVIYTRSSALVDWKSVVSPSGKFMDIIWAAELGLLIAISFGSNSLCTSPDGINWTVQTNPSGNTYWRKLAWSGSILLVLGDWGIMTSTDAVNFIYTINGGITYTNSASNFGGEADICFDGTNFVGIITGTQSSTTYSPDGATWTYGGSTPGSATGVGAYHFPDKPGLVFRLGGSDAISRPNITYSNDSGVTWATANASTNGVYQMVYSKSLDLFVAITYSPNNSQTILTSTTGLSNWVYNSATPINGLDWIIWSEQLGLFIAGAYYGAYMSSVDGFNWTDEGTILAGMAGVHEGVWVDELSMFILIEGGNTPETTQITINRA